MRLFGASGGGAGRRGTRGGRVAVVALAAALAGPASAQDPAPAAPLLPTPPPSPLSEAIPKPVLESAPQPAPGVAGPRIVEIAVQGGKTVTPETIAFYLGVKVGDAYNPELLQRNFGRLWDSGLFEDLSLEKEDVPGGVKIVAVLVERPTVADLEFRGNKKLTTSQLKDKLKEGKAEIKIGSPISLREVAKAKTVLGEAYKAEGFRSVFIETRIEQVAENTRRVVFQIDEGDKLKVESIRFTGNTVFGQQTLRNAMKKTAVDHWWRFYDSKSTYNQASYDEDVDSLRKIYQNKGYKDVVVKDAILDVYVVDPRETRSDKVKRRVRITIPIVEGERFYFGTVKVEGATVFSGPRLEKAFEYTPGKPLSRAVIEDGLKTLDGLYRSRGYIYAFMNPEFTEKGKNVVDVTIRLTEGDQYRLGRVEFSGNKTTRDKVLRREIPLNEGDIMDIEIFKKGIQKITQLGYFKIEEDPDYKVNPDQKTVDITLKGTDVNRNEVQFGAGYSQLDGFFGQFQFNTRNFLGRGDTLGVQFQKGSTSNFLDLAFTEPYFLDQRMSIGGSVYNRGVEYLDVNQKTKGVSASVGYGLGLFDVVSLFYGFTDTNSQYQGFPPPAPPGAGIPPAAFATFTGRTSSVTPGYRYDSRNDPFDPTRGMRYGAAVSLAGGPLGGDFSYIKPSASFTWYLPATRRSNFAFNFEGGFIDAYNSKEIPIFERYRIGGDRSIRGFKFGAIFPIEYRDGKYRAYFDAQGALLGGNKFYYFNIEYVYAVAGPVKLAAFFDAGNTWIEVQPFTPFVLRAAYGLEARIFLPIFQAPLRFIYGIKTKAITIYDQRGFPIANGTEAKSEFTFTIGSTF
ncbi:MAG TPA: outer membrane protein assembly factor BamA [Thermoanaerobaculia bacterium]|nr:outer membrane protein assembly factor BamA [Thermoanaerobaculia bacterium]